MPQTVSIKPGLAVPIHSGKKLFVEFGSLGGQFQCTCVGAVENQHIIIRPPAGVTLPMVNMSENVSLVVKFLDGGTIYGFRSIIEHVIQRPYLLLFISHPFHAEELELRRDIRCPCFIPMNCVVEKSGAEMYGFITDLNRHGCRFVATRLVGEVGGLAPGEDVLLNCTMSSIELTGLRCTLRTVCANGKSGVFGATFAAPDPQAELVIDDYATNYKLVLELQDAHLKAGTGSCPG